jgi:hypothetical protein
MSLIHSLLKLLFRNSTLSFWMTQSWKEQNLACWLKSKAAIKHCQLGFQFMWIVAVKNSGNMNYNKVHIFVENSLVCSIIPQLFPNISWHPSIVLSRITHPCYILNTQSAIKIRLLLYTGQSSLDGNIYRFHSCNRNLHSLQQDILIKHFGFLNGSRDTDVLI